MKRLLLTRLVAVPPVLLVVSFVVFMLVALVPGDAAVTLAGGQNATPEAIAAVRAELNLDDPVLVRYGHWIGNLFQGDMGHSLVTKIPVTEELANRLPVTLSLVLAALIVTLLVGIPLGIASGTRPGGPRDAVSRLLASLGIAIPQFWLAILLVSVFAVTWKVFPPSGFVEIQDSFTGWLRTVTLPAVSMGLLCATSVARQIRPALIETLNTNYVRTAWAKGCGGSRVVLRHALRNAAMPAVTVLGLQMGYLLGGAVIIEQIFTIPGIGTYMLKGITGPDLPVVQGVVLIFVLFQMAMSLLVDVSYGLLNPKVRVSG